MKTQTRSRNAKLAGFTLIELLTALVVGAILFSIGIPSYLSQVRKSRRVDARTAMLDLAGRQERLYATTNAYSATPSVLGYTAPGDVFPMTVGSGYYQIAVAANAGPPATFTLTGTPVAGMGQENDTDCASFTVDQAGRQTALNGSAVDNSAECWR
jgi:type IV pilus assembly protein PilE